jgi:hypothetical protein
MSSPLCRFLQEITEIEGGTKYALCAGVLDSVSFLPDQAKVAKALRESHALFVGVLRKHMGWLDVEKWIESTAPSYQKSLEDLARAAYEARELAGAHILIAAIWRSRLSDALEQLLDPDTPASRRMLCAFSSAVDATFRGGWEAFLQDAATRRGIGANKLLQLAFEEYWKNPALDRKDVATIEEAVAAVMFAYRNPGATLKPTLTPGSPAESWLRDLYAKNSNKNVDDNAATPPKTIAITGGGASVNIADALAALGFPTDVFWPYHSKELASAPLLCSGGVPSNLQRCWFDPDDSWRWHRTDYSVAGNQADRTGTDHPVRMSLILPFDRNSPPIGKGVLPQLKEGIISAGQGRLIFQFKGHRPPSFFAPQAEQADQGNPVDPSLAWPSEPAFCRWSWAGTCVPETATNVGMQHVRNAGYHRVILSGIQAVSEDQEKRKKQIETLCDQCQDLHIHHEISGSFRSAKAVKDYCEILKAIYLGREATVREGNSAGMNDTELASFTSWYGTEMFSAACPTGKDAFLQSFFRAMQVRACFGLDFLYVHGNDIDIAVVHPQKDEPYLEDLRSAMLAAKAVVSAALHVRSEISQVTDSFELVCSPKGLLALYQFAKDFARQYEPDEEKRKSLQGRIITDGYVHNVAEVDSVVVVPVYWPDPQEGCSVTGAGDISSGVTAALAPSPTSLARAESLKAA